MINNILSIGLSTGIIGIIFWIFSRMSKLKTDNKELNNKVHDLEEEKKIIQNINEMTVKADEASKNVKNVNINDNIKRMSDNEL